MVRPSNNALGTLYVVATPIGNLGDLSLRAQEVLSRVDLIAAEDTRHTGQLLKHFGIRTPTLSLHEHNEAARRDVLLERLTGGQSIALVSDAGTPLISDPGFDLIAAARSRSIALVAIPGPCAAIAALSIAGLPTDRFAFEGFLAAKSNARRAQLERLCAENRTMVFYEAPHRLGEVLNDMAAIFGGERRAVVCREMTKHFETTYADSLAGLSRASETDTDMSRGEIVIVVEGSKSDVHPTAIQADQLLRALLEDLPPSQAAKIAARLTGEKRSALYERAMGLKK
jgi:16S rRNA (cytidine1402-2'-O)-methyltransferase